MSFSRYAQQSVDEHATKLPYSSLSKVHLATAGTHEDGGLVLKVHFAP